MKDYIDELLGNLGKPKGKETVDLDLAFLVWSSKQKFYERLIGSSDAKLTITKDQLLSLMKESYKAGYKRA